MLKRAGENSPQWIVPPTCHLPTPFCSPILPHSLTNVVLFVNIVQPHRSAAAVDPCHRGHPCGVSAGRHMHDSHGLRHRPRTYVRTSNFETFFIPTSVTSLSAFDLILNPWRRCYPDIPTHFLSRHDALTVLSPCLLVSCVPAGGCSVQGPVLRHGDGRAGAQHHHALHRRLHRQPRVRPPINVRPRS